MSSGLRTLGFCLLRVCTGLLTLFSFDFPAVMFYAKSHECLQNRHNVCRQAGAKELDEEIGIRQIGTADELLVLREG
jgi:hypothetical protein